MFSSEQVLEINGYTKEELISTLNFALKLASSKAPTAFILKENTLDLIFNNNSSAKEYPFEPTPVVLAEQIITWLSKIEYPFCPYDGDGSAVKGWRISANNENIFGAIRVSPDWVYYAK